MRLARAPPAPLRAPGRGHRAGRRGRAPPAAGHDRHDQDEPCTRGRRRPAGGVGRARRRQPRPHPPAATARLPLRARPLQPAVLLDRRQRRQQLRRSPLPRLRGHRRPRPGPRGGAARRRAGDAGRPRPGAGRPRPARRRRGQSEGMLGIVTEGGGAPHPEPAGGAAPAHGLRRAGRRRGHRVGHHRRGRRARRGRDDGPAHHPGGRGLRPRRLPDRRRGDPLRRARRPARGRGGRVRHRRGPGSAPPGPHDPGGGGRGRAPAAVEGAQDGVRRGRPGRSRTTTCTTRSSPAPACSRC